MTLISSARPRPGRRARRLVALVALALLCLTIALLFAGSALAEGGTITTSNGTVITTSEGMETPEVDYTFVWWSFLLTFGLLALYYFAVLRISNTEFKKIVDVHFGPKHDGR
jgi:hypothetical protein